jgi:phosphoribosylformylglycinamidine synthase
MSGSSLPIAVSHGEGRAFFKHPSDLQALTEAQMVPIRYINNYGKITTKYPANPDGSPEGIAGVRSRDGRVLALIHIRNVQSWRM